MSSSGQTWQFMNGKIELSVCVCVRRSGDRFVWCWVIRGTPAHTCQAVSTHGEHMLKRREGGCRWEKGRWAKKIMEEDAEQEGQSGRVLHKKVSVKLAECGNPTDPLLAVGAAPDGSRKQAQDQQIYPREAGAGGCWQNLRIDTDPLSLCSHLLSKPLLPCRNFWRKSVPMSPAEGEHTGCTYGSNVSAIPAALLTHTLTPACLSEVTTRFLQ